MTHVMKKILERVLSEEIGRQQAWAKNEGSDREFLIKEIENFMTEEGIRPDLGFIDKGYSETIK